MTDRTTISITTDLKEELDSEKNHPSESYESLLWRLVDSYRRLDAETIAARVVEELED